MAALLRFFYSPLISAIIIIFNLFLIVHYQDNKNFYKIEHVNTTIYIDDDFNQKEIEYIILAATEWSNATNNIVEYNFILSTNLDNKTDLSKDKLFFKKVSKYNPDIFLIDLARDSKTIGLYIGASSTPTILLVSNRLDNSIYKSVIMHEIGHSLGLRHIDGAYGLDTLMYPYIDFGADYITSKDLIQFCTKYNCNSINK